jgi:predicted PurR-regulated permease PerM
MSSHANPGDPADSRELVLASRSDRDRMRLTILVVLAGAAVFAIAGLLAPFTLALVTSGVVATLAHPGYRRLRERVGNGSAAALLATSAIFVLVLIPAGAMLLLVVRQIEAGASVVVDGLAEITSQQGQAWEWLQSVAALLGVDPQNLREALENQAGEAAGVLADGTLGLLTGLGGWIAQGGIALFTLFYLLRDGEGLIRFTRWLIPFDPALTDALVQETRDVVSATVLGTLVVAAVQGALGGLLFWVLGLPAPAVWGTVMAFFALLPAIGPPIVWIPTALMLVARGDLVDAAVVAGVGALVIGTIDNVLRAVLVGERAELHPLVVFFSVLGGVVVYGAAGFLFGPVLFVIALSVLEIARVALRGAGEGNVPVDDTIFARVRVPKGRRALSRRARPAGAG